MTSWHRLFLAFLILACAHGVAGAPLPPDSQTLQVYFVDVEGGQATLFVSSSGQSLLIDTGWPGFEGRDANRIVAAAKLAGVTKLDYVLLTHYHMDHAGGITQLADRISIGAVIDHGENREHGDKVTEGVWQDYQKLLAGKKIKRIIAKPGEVLPMTGMRVDVITADGEMIKDALPGAGAQNAACKSSETRAADPSENPRSLGTLITFGKTRILDLGDLTRDKEMALMCPVNRIGHVDVFIVNHHGSDQSDSPELVWGIASRVAIMDNGATKGASASTVDIIKKSPGLEDLWQLHFATEGGAAHNASNEFIANVDGTDAGHYLKLTAWQDGSFEVLNARTQKTKKYAAKP